MVIVYIVHYNSLPSVLLSTREERMISEALPDGGTQTAAALEGTF